MKKQEIIKKVSEIVKAELEKNDASHDFWHIYRVWKLAKNIGEKEGGNMFVIELGALLHDIADHKYYNGDETVGPKKAKKILEKFDVEEDVIKHIINIIENISFSKSLEGERKFSSKELEIIQDADMLDAIGAIGIARTFVYGGAKKREMYNPEIKPKLNMTKEEYKKDNGPTINHFYEKLLLLKDKMNTQTGKQIAEHRHNYMLGFLDEFMQEWKGKI